MTPRDIVIVGTGGSGRETLTVIRAIEANSPGSWNVRGFVGLDEPDADILCRLDVPFLGASQDLTSRVPEATGWHFVVGIGNGERRRTIEDELLAQGLSAATLIHPSAQIGPDVTIDAGSVVCANVVITTNVRMGRSAQVNIGCIVAHDARIGDHVTFAQSVNVCGNVTIQYGATLFTGAVLTPGITIGARATVGAGSVVLQDVPAETTVVGVPARSLA